MSSVISLSERSLSRFFLFPIFLIDETDLGQVSLRADFTTAVEKSREKEKDFSFSLDFSSAVVKSARRLGASP